MASSSAMQTQTTPASTVPEGRKRAFFGSLTREQRAGAERLPPDFLEDLVLTWPGLDDDVIPDGPNKHFLSSLTQAQRTEALKFPPELLSKAVQKWETQTQALLKDGVRIKSPAADDFFCRLFPAERLGMEKVPPAAFNEIAQNWARGHTQEQAKPGFGTTDSFLVKLTPEQKAAAKDLPAARLADIVRIYSQSANPPPLQMRIKLEQEMRIQLNQHHEPPLPNNTTPQVFGQLMDLQRRIKREERLVAMQHGVATPQQQQGVKMLLQEQQKIDRTYPGSVAMIQQRWRQFERQHTRQREIERLEEEQKRDFSLCQAKQLRSYAQAYFAIRLNYYQTEQRAQALFEEEHALHQKQQRAKHFKAFMAEEIAIYRKQQEEEREFDRRSSIKSETSGSDLGSYKGNTTDSSSSNTVVDNRVRGKRRSTFDDLRTSKGRKR
ncbi:hypothetical protein QQX98_004304 [Neonectria punicea]|uniref:Uncharacterized protein n=1 Tax=Neonectria punicea TaxID=979145 RepID=A0ABR1H9X9_9HYPO